MIMTKVISYSHGEISRVNTYQYMEYVATSDILFRYNLLLFAII